MINTLLLLFAYLIRRAEVLIVRPQRSALHLPQMRCCKVKAGSKQIQENGIYSQTTYFADIQIYTKQQSLQVTKYESKEKEW